MIYLTLFVVGYRGGFPAFKLSRMTVGLKSESLSSYEWVSLMTGVKMLSRILLLTDLCVSIGFILNYSLNLSIH